MQSAQRAPSGFHQTRSRSSYMLPTAPITSSIFWTGLQERSSQNSDGLVTKVAILQTPIVSQLTRRVTSLSAKYLMGEKFRCGEQLRSKTARGSEVPPLGEF